MVHYKFFKGKDASSPIFNKKLEEAMDLIQKNQSLVAINVLEAINANKITIYPFSNISKKCYFAMVKDRPSLNLPTEFPPTPTAVQNIENAYHGMIYGNIIYLSFKYDPSEIASTIIHEVCHFLNAKINKKDYTLMPVKLADFYDEVRSFTAEKIFEKNGRCILRSDVKEIYSLISAGYPDLTKPLDKSGQGYVYGSYDVPAP